MHKLVNDSDIEFTSTTVVVISSLTLYYFIEQCLRNLTWSFTPCFYKKLQASRKDPVFFGIGMGLIISILSTPFCAYAALDVWNHSVGSEGTWSFRPHTRICVTSRSVLWVSELNRLDMYGLYVFHHTGSILALVSWLHFRWPNLPFLTLFTTLISEVPGDLVFMISAYRETLNEVVPNLERFRYHLIRFNTLQYTLVRGAGILTVTRMLWSDAPGIYDRSMTEQLYAYSLLGLYAIFCASYVFRQLKSWPSTTSTASSYKESEKMVDLVRKQV